MKIKIFGVMVIVAMVFVGNRVASASEWRFPVGLTYISGFNDIVDIYKNDLEAEGYTVDSSMGVPIGLSFQPYFQFDNGLGVGVGIGPPMMISSTNVDFTALPVSADLRFFFAPDASVSPYVRAGVRKINASGDYVVSSTSGFFEASG